MKELLLRSFLNREMLLLKKAGIVPAFFYVCSAKNYGHKNYNNLDYAGLYTLSHYR